jgi:pimeloyl-ACP methyl ester carboxylesterase
MAEGDEWLPVAEALAGSARVGWYDRAGRGASDAGPPPRSAETMAVELHHMLKGANLPGPYLLVGHSLGGLIIRLFASRYPDETAGLILVDPTHEDQFDRVGAALPPETAQEADALTFLRRFWTQDFRDPTKNPEGVDFVRSCRQARAVKSLGDIPLRLLLAEEGMSNLGLPAATVHRLKKIMRELHTQTAQLSSASEMISISNSGHFIQKDQPETIIDAVQQLLALLRRSENMQVDQRLSGAQAE